MKVLSFISIGIILASAIGIIGKDVKKRALGIFLDSVGLLLLMNSIGTNYGFYAGIEIAIFVVPVLILFLWLFLSLCKKNELQKLSDLKNFRKEQPFTFFLFVIMGLILIGLPGTGTFNAYMFGASGMFKNEVNAYTIVLLFSVMVGVISLCIQLFGIWIEMLIVNQESDDSKKFVPLSKGISVVVTAVLIILCGLGTYHVPILMGISKLYEMMK